MNPKTTLQAGHVSQDSPKVHPAGVKLGNAKKSLYIKEKYISLSCFTISPAPPPARAYTRARVSGGESRETCPDPRSPALAPRSPTLARVAFFCFVWPFVPRPPAARPGANVAYPVQIPPAVGTSGDFSAGDPGGNSREPSHSLFHLSERP